MDLQTILNFGGFIIGIVSILLSIQFYQKSIDRREPRYSFDTFKSIDKLSEANNSHIKIFYDDIQVDRVCTTWLTFWNKGKIAINKQDLKSDGFLILELVDENPQTHILDFKVARTTRKELGFSLTRVSNTSLKIEFEFLDQDDGVVIEIQHTGSLDSQFEIKGIILGVRKGVKIASSDPEGILNLGRITGMKRANRRSLGQKLTITMTVIATYGIVLNLLFLSLFLKQNGILPTLPMIDPVAVIGILSLIAILGIAYVWRSDRVGFPLNLQPKPKKMPGS